MPTWRARILRRRACRAWSIFEWAPHSTRCLVWRYWPQFDLTFIDADKANIPEYFIWALTLSRIGSVIIVDNVVRDGRVIDGSSVDPSVVGVRRLNDMLAMEPRVSATTLQTVGSKGYDGLTLAVVVA